MKRAHFCTLLTAFALGSLLAGCQGRIPGNHKYTPTTNGSFADLAVSGPYAFATQSSLGLHVLDVSNPELVHEVGAFQSAADGRFQLVDHLVFFAGHSPCLQIVDVNDPTMP